jgi:hypothetical protein
MYGSPELLELREIDPPVPKPKEGAGRRACVATRTALHFHAINGAARFEFDRAWQASNQPVTGHFERLIWRMPTVLFPGSMIRAAWAKPMPAIPSPVVTSLRSPADCDGSLWLRPSPFLIRAPRGPLQKRAPLWFSCATGRTAVRPVPDRCGKAASSRCLRARQCGSATQTGQGSGTARGRVSLGREVPPRCL